MEKRLSLDIEKGVKEELKKRKILRLKVHDEDFVVRIKYRLSHDDKTEMLQDIARLYTEFEEQPYAEQIVTSIAMLRAITDIEFPESMEDKVKLMLILADSHLIDKIFEAIPPDLIEDLAQFLKFATENISELVKVETVKNLES